MKFTKPTSPKAIAKFEKIVEAAEEQFYSVGFEKTSIANITNAAGIAVGTFYLYFESKIAIYYYILFNYQDRIKHYIAEKISLAETRYEKERLGFIAWVEFISKNPRTYGIIWQSLFIDKKLFDDYYKNFAKSYSHSVIKDKDEIIDVNIDTLTYVLMGISSFLGLKQIVENKCLTDEEIEIVADSVMRILSEPLFKKK